MTPLWIDGTSNITRPLNHHSFFHSFFYDMLESETKFTFISILRYFTGFLGQYGPYPNVRTFYYATYAQTKRYYNNIQIIDFYESETKFTFISILRYFTGFLGQYGPYPNVRTFYYATYAQTKRYYNNIQIKRFL